MRLVQLKYFMEVAQSGSIDHSAQKLFATQQTLNAALNAWKMRWDILCLSAARRG